MFAPLSEEAAAKEAHANVPVIDRDEVGAPVLRDDTVVMSVGSARTLLYDLPSAAELSEIIAEFPFFCKVFPAACDFFSPMI